MQIDPEFIEWFATSGVFPIEGDAIAFSKDGSLITYMAKVYEHRFYHQEPSDVFSHNPYLRANQLRQAAVRQCHEIYDAENKA